MTKRNATWTSMIVAAALALQVGFAPSAHAKYEDRSDELPGFADESDIWLVAGLGVAAVTAIVLAIVLLPGDGDDAASAGAEALAQADDSDVDVFVDVKPADASGTSFDASDLALQVGVTGAF